MADQRADDGEAGALHVGLDRVADVAEVVAGTHCSTALNSDSRVTSSSLAATGLTSPTGKVIAPSATQPSLVTPTSMEMMSPRWSLNGPGMPCTTMWFGDAQMEPVKPR